jgi:hypothetical protein
MLCRNEKRKGKKIKKREREGKKRKEINEKNSRLQNRDMKKSAHQHSSVPGRYRDLCDLRIVTYKLHLNNYSYNYYDYILNLVGISTGRCLCIVLILCN